MGTVLSLLSCTTRTSTSISQADTNPELVVIVLKGAASQQRLEWESKAITEGVGTAGRVHPYCSIDEVEAALRKEFSGDVRSKRRRDAARPPKIVILHVIGYACATSQIGRVPTRKEKTLSCEKLRSEIKPLPGTVDVSTSRPQFIQAIERALGESKLDLVFCNASDSAQLARSLPANRRFGWASACVEEGAARYAANFFAALGRGLQIDAAFREASEQLKKTQIAVSIRRSTGIRDTALIEKVLYLGDPEANNVQVGSSPRDRDLGEGAAQNWFAQIQEQHHQDGEPVRMDLHAGYNYEEMDHEEYQGGIDEKMEYEYLYDFYFRQSDLDSVRTDDNGSIDTSRSTPTIPIGLPMLSDASDQVVDIPVEQPPQDVSVVPTQSQPLFPHSCGPTDHSGQRTANRFNSQSNVEHPAQPRPLQVRPRPNGNQNNAGQDLGLDSQRTVVTPPPTPPVMPRPNGNERPLPPENGLTPPPTPPVMPRPNGNERPLPPENGHAPDNLHPPHERQSIPENGHASNNGHPSQERPAAAPRLPVLPAGIGTIIDRQLPAIGRMKRTRLARYGIHTIEELAAIDLSDIELCQNVTNNHSNPNQAVKTVRTWKDSAQRWLRPREM